jgi:hypothetical protein
MTVEWIEAIYDRTYGDVLNLEANRDNSDTKGGYNYYDLNRMENNTKYCMEYMVEHKIIKTPPSLAIKTTWVETDIPTRDDMIRIIRNISVLMESSNPEITDDFSAVYESSQFTYSLANALEKNLDLMHNQPELPIQKWLLTVENGIISTGDGTTGSSVYVAENETVNIQFVPFGDSAAYMSFTNWSGNTDDLQYVGNVNAQVTTYTMQYHDDDDYVVTITGNYKIRLPRTLTLHDGTIYDDVGGTTRQYFAGDSILLLADDAPMDKVFYEWLGTQEALDNLTGGAQPSTSWLTMPDCDVELTANFISPGKHKVTIDDEVLGSYDYKETVKLSYTDKGTKWKFTGWSGDTGYLEEVTSMTLTMPDCNVTLTSTWSYIYSYNNAVTLIDATMDDSTVVGGLTEGTRKTIVADKEPEGTGFYNWSVEGVGYVADSFKSTTTFTVGDGNATVTANFHKKYNITVANADNDSNTNIYTHMYGEKVSISTSLYPTNYTFDHWEDSSGNNISTKTYYEFTMPEKDVTFTAVYKWAGTFTLTMLNKNNTGKSEKISVHGGTKGTMSTTLLDGDYILDHWENEDGTSISTDTSHAVYINEDRTFTAVYRKRETYNVTVMNGTGSGNFLEHTEITISANAPEDKDSTFYSWSGNYASIGWVYSSETTIVTPRADCVMTPNYITLYTLTVVNGSGSGTYRAGTTVTCRPNTAPEGQEFAGWVGDDGTTIISYSNPWKLGLNSTRTITATYKTIPYYTVTLVNGVLLDSGETTGRYIRGSSPGIKMNPAPEGYKFLQWEVSKGSEDDITRPAASTTSIRSLTHNVTAEAVYYIPNPDIQYSLSIISKDGTTNIEYHCVGDQVKIEADDADEGYKFYKWVGDTQYVDDKYSSETTVNMPNKNISLQMEYRREGYTTMYHLLLEGGNCLVETSSDGTEKWDIEGEYEEGSTVRIKAVDIPLGYRFTMWEDTDDGKSTSTVEDTGSAETTVRVEDFDITLTRGIAPKDTYTMKIINGEVSGSYYEGNPVPIYFNLEDTDDVHYQFIKWSGDDVAYLKLADTGIFDVLEPTEQTVSMPARDITITGTYTATYSLNINAVSQGYYMKDEQVPISADEIEGKSFLYWSGDTQYIDNKYNPNATVTMPDLAVNIKPVYHNKSENNSIGYVEYSLYDIANIKISDIIIISGEVDSGFLITDSDGHIYIVTEVADNTCNILRLTQTSGGEKDGE